MAACVFHEPGAAGFYGPSLDCEHTVVYTSVADKRIRNIWGK